MTLPVYCGVGSRKRGAPQRDTHGIVKMCLTGGRRAVLSFIWAAKLLRSPKRRRMAGGAVPWSTFNWLQHGYLHRALLGAHKPLRSGSRASSSPFTRLVQPEGAASPPVASTATPPHPVLPAITDGIGLASPLCSPVVTAAKPRVATSAALKACSSDPNPTTSACSQKAACSPRAATPAGPAVSLTDLADAPCGSLRGAGGATGHASLLNASGHAASGHAASGHAASGHVSSQASGVPSAMCVARGGTPLLTAMRSKRPQPKPAAVVARTPVGPATNLQELLARDLERLLRGGCWLNDEVVNFYLRLIMKRNDEHHRATPAPCPASTEPAATSPPSASPARQPSSGPRASGAAASPVASSCARRQDAEPLPCVAAAAAAADPSTPALALAPGPSPTTTSKHGAAAAVMVATVAAGRGINAAAVAAAAAVATTAAGLGAVVAAVSRSGASLQCTPRRQGSDGTRPAASDLQHSAGPPACSAGGGGSFGPVEPYRVFAFNSFFFSKLTADGDRRRFEYGEVRRWTLPCRTHTPDCVLARDLILVPINHRNTHWCLAAIWPRRRLLQYFDSLGGTAGTADWVLDTLLRWVLKDAEDKGVTLGSAAVSELGAPAPGRRRAVAGGLKAAAAAGWRKEQSPSRLPRQLDGSSCGVFVCAFAELLAGGVPPQDFRFSQADIPSIRRGMAEQILRAEL